MAEPWIDRADAAEELLSTVAHDLRNPLSCIEGYAAMLLDKPSGNEPERRAALQRIISCSRFAEKIVDDLTDLSSLERGSLELDLKPTRLSDIAREELSLHEFAAVKRRVSLTLRVNPGSHIVRADRERIRRVLGNLVSNALRHVREGSGRVEVRLHEVEGEVIVEVADNGDGIAREEQSRVFEKFHQSDALHRGSLGLGLHIARRLVEAHHGRLWLKSEGLGKGASFFVGLPRFDPDRAFQEFRAATGAPTPVPNRLAKAAPQDETESAALTAGILMKLGLLSLLSAAHLWLTRL